MAGVSHERSSRCEAQRLPRGELFGEIERRGPSRYRFTYSDEVLERHGEGAVALSASLPIQPEVFAPARAAPFFEGLLPEGSVRAAIARSFHLSEEDGFGMLDALGADCAGAVEVLGPGVRPAPVGGGRLRPLNGGELARLIEELPRNPLGVDPASDGVRLSLGGIQHKLVLAGSNGSDGIGGGQILTGFSQPLEGAPSTCLLKPEYGPYEDLVANEAFCMHVAIGVGLEVAPDERDLGRFDPLSLRAAVRPCGRRARRGYSSAPRGPLPGTWHPAGCQVRRERRPIGCNDRWAVAEAAGPAYGPGRQ